MAAVALIAAGFLVRRTLLPRALDSVRRRPAPHAREVARDSRIDPGNRNAQAVRRPAADRAAAGADRATHSRETLTESDRRELDQVLKRNFK
jgi:hypothetical protein